MKIKLENRLDIFVKILYIDAFLNKNNNFNFYLKLYQKHIKLYNGAIEDHKKNIKDFEKDFQNLILNIKNKGFDENYPIEINENNELINGAHRLACCLYFNIKPIFIETKGKGIIWNINYFNNKNYSNNELIDIVNCYTNYEKEFLIYIIWPTLLHKSKEIIKDINKIGQLISNIEINFNKKELSEIIKDIYSYDNENIKGGLGIDKKIILLNKTSNKNFKILIYKKNKNINERDFKDDLRKQYEIFTGVNDGTERFYTFHSGEDQNENNYIKKILLNKNNLNSFKIRANIEDNSKLIKRIYNFYNYIENNNLIKENFCIVGSSILEIYGLRQGKDLDFISNNINKKNKTIKIDNNIEIFQYQYSKILSNEKIINNKEYHLYFRGLKYINPNLFLKIKKNFHRKKDINDVKLLELLNKNNNNFLSDIIFNFKYYKKFIITHFILKSIFITKKIGIYKQISYLWRKYILKNYKGK